MPVLVVQRELVTVDRHVRIDWLLCYWWPEINSFDVGKGIAAQRDVSVFFNWDFSHCETLSKVKLKIILWIFMRILQMNLSFFKDSTILQSSWACHPLLSKSTLCLFIISTIHVCSTLKTHRDLLDSYKNWTSAAVIMICDSKTVIT